MFGQRAKQIHQPLLGDLACSYEAKAVLIVLVRQVGDGHALSSQFNGHSLQCPNYNGGRNLKRYYDLLKELVVRRSGHYTSLLCIQAIFAAETIRTSHKELGKLEPIQGIFR